MRVNRQRVQVVNHITIPVATMDYRISAHFADHHASGLCAGDALHLAIAYNHGLELCSLDQTLVGGGGATGGQRVVTVSALLPVLEIDLSRFLGYWK